METHTAVILGFLLALAALLLIGVAYLLLSYGAKTASRFVVFYLKDVPMRVWVGAEVVLPLVVKLEGRHATQVAGQVRGARVLEVGPRRMRLEVVRGSWHETFTVSTRLEPLRKPNREAYKGTAVTIEPEHDAEVGYRSRRDLRILLRTVDDLAKACRLVRHPVVSKQFMGRVEVPGRGRWNRTILHHDAWEMEVVLEGTVLEFRCADISGVEDAINRYISRPFDILGREWGKR